MSEGVCFSCCQRVELVPGHHICFGCHDVRRCRRENCTLRYANQPKKPKTGGTSMYKRKCFQALAELGGRGTSGEIALLTGYTSVQVSASLRAAKGVRFETDPVTGKKPGGVWCLEPDTDSESTASEVSEPLAA